MAHKVKCAICGKQFDRDKVAAVEVAVRKYAHQSCYSSMTREQAREQKSKANLETYLKKLFNTNFVTPIVQKQLNTYVKEYNYTYENILNTLKYIVEIKKILINQNGYGIGIVPYYYDEAVKYCLDVFNAQMKAPSKIEKAKEISVSIRSPKRESKKSSQFGFLDEEEEN